MKKILSLVALGILIINGCTSILISPELYQEEIEDSVKFNIATCMVLGDRHSLIEKKAENASFLFGDFFSSSYEKDWNKFCDTIDAFERYMLRLVDQSEYTNGNYMILKQISKDSSNPWCRIADMVLEKYNDIDVVISDYYEIETSSDVRIWQFTELNTGLEGTFVFENDTYSCGLTDSSMEELLLTLFL